MNILQAIKIDVTTQSVYIVEIPKVGILKAFYEHINCDTVSHFHLDEYHGCYVDDEGLYRDRLGYWSLSGFRQSITENSIISGVDHAGYEAPALPAILEWLQSMIRFYRADEVVTEPVIRIVSF
ncbi:hypothetical protein [Xanthocytophaga agilis]|uniref:Uncharacterized protein n=1 Tax=Xanthocytophaga agilis TaxID=3048010 RepID=A0AAE3R4D9_9BACT|nr:hypothetical protein [Xanthocytophaga agilis]MDJ1503534.1 hypothetical protein [Xanthocytophaga agilis]